MYTDLINGLFEVGGAFLLSLNVRQLNRDKRLAGVHWGPTVFFSLWGFWNLYYYPQLDQIFSFFGGLAIVIVNVIWLIQVWWYSNNGKSRSSEIRK